MSNLEDEHIVAAKGVRRYLKGTPDLGVRYSKILPFTDILMLSHSDDPNKFRSVLGYLQRFAGGPVRLSANKQPVVALSSCDSGYIALTYASQKAVYLSDLFSE